MSNGILVFVEHRAGAVSKQAIEAIAAASDLAGQRGGNLTVTAVVLGALDPALVQEIATYNVSNVVHATNSKLNDYTPDGYTDAMERVVRQLDPEFVVMPHTYLVRDFAPKLAARFEKALISDCIRARTESGTTTCKIILRSPSGPNSPRAERQGKASAWAKMKTVSTLMPLPRPGPPLR